MRTRTIISIDDINFSSFCQQSLTHFKIGKLSSPMKGRVFTGGAIIDKCTVVNKDFNAFRSFYGDRIWTNA